MPGKFSPGDVVGCKGGPVRILEYLGEGGQGEVYAVEQNGKKKALKWYKPGGTGRDPEAFYTNLCSNAAKGAPDGKLFIWPEAVTERKDGSFGYVMPLRPEGYHEISEYLLTAVRFRSMQTAVDAALNIARAFRLLHNGGYCYQDLNDGNFFIRPETGEVLVCDNDNVAPEGKHTGIIGKPGYIAPELIRQMPGAVRSPDSLSDRFSMSIIVFMLLCLTRPLEGRRCVRESRTDEFMAKVYGDDAHFILEDPDHPDYGPDETAHRNVYSWWPALPPYVKKFFLRAFGRKAMDNPAFRPTEADWVDLLVRFRSDIVKCACGATVLTRDGRPTKCGKCGKPIRIPCRLQLEKKGYCLPGLPDSRIYRCMVGACDADESLTLVGRVSGGEGGEEPGIQNLSEKYWNAETPSGRQRKAMPQETVPLRPGIRLFIEDETVAILKN